MWIFETIKDIFLVMAVAFLICIIVGIVLAVVEVVKTRKRATQEPQKITGKIAVTGTYKELKEATSPYYCGSNDRTKYRVQRTHFSDLERFGNENMAPFTVKGINPRTNKTNTVHIKYARDREHAIELAVKEKGGQLKEPYTVTCDYKFYSPSDKQIHYMYGIVNDVPPDISNFDTHCIIDIYVSGKFEMPPRFLSNFADKEGVHISAYMSAADMCIQLMMLPDKKTNCFGLMAWTICDVLYEEPDAQYERVCNEFSKECCENEQLLKSMEKLVKNGEFDDFVPKTSGRPCAKISRSFLKEREARYGIQRKNYAYVDF